MMNVKLTSVILRKHKSIGEVQTCAVVNGKIKIIDVYNCEHVYSTAEWECVCYEGPVKCCNCGKDFIYDGDTCAMYRGDFLCPDCYQNEYGYCNECGELHKYAQMNEDIVCGGCEDGKNI